MYAPIQRSLQFLVGKYADELQILWGNIYWFTYKWLDLGYIFIINTSKVAKMGQIEWAEIRIKSMFNAYNILNRFVNIWKVLPIVS